MNPDADDPELASTKSLAWASCNLVALGRGDPLAVAAEMVLSSRGPAGFQLRIDTTTVRLSTNDTIQTDCPL